MLLSEARERGIVGNNIPENMVEVERKLERLSKVTVEAAGGWDWDWN